MSEIVTLEQNNALEVLLKKNGLEPYIDEVKAAVSGFVGDVSTRKGRDEVASTAYKITRSKTYLDNIGKAVVTELKKQPKIIDAERKRMREALDELADEIRKPLTEWEEAEKERRAAIETMIEHIKSLCIFKENYNSEDVTVRINEIQAISVDDWFAEYLAEAVEAKKNTTNLLHATLERKLAEEEEKAELERLRKLEAEQKQKEHDEKVAEEAVENYKKSGPVEGFVHQEKNKFNVTEHTEDTETLSDLSFFVGYEFAAIILEAIKSGKIRNVKWEGSDDGTN